MYLIDGLQGVDEERRILLEDQDEQPVSDRPAASSTDETGRHMKRQYGTSSLHSASETSPVSQLLLLTSQQ